MKSEPSVRQSKRCFLILTLLFCGILFENAAFANAKEMVLVPSGVYKPFFKEQDSTPVNISAFYLDKFPVTNSQFKKFLDRKPSFNKGAIASLFVGPAYLQHWPVTSSAGQRPVVYVSWFVAREYCKFYGKRLPTLVEWEYASHADDPKVIEAILRWYSRPESSPTKSIGQSEANKFGLSDMHGLIWEWVEDFYTVMVSTDSRGKGGGKRNDLFCGGGSVNAEDAKQYATFMRFAFRNSVSAKDTLGTLGFRCARDKEK